MTYLLLKAFHIIAMVAWFAGIFYLPRLFVYHSSTDDEVSLERFKVMEHKLLYYIMTPAAIVTLILGLALIHHLGIDIFKLYWWLTIKLILVILLIGFHLYCARITARLAKNQNPHSEKFYRIFNELPVLLLIAIVVLAVVKPF